MPGGVTLLSLGTDHFPADDPRFEGKVVALMRLMFEWVETQPAERCRPAR